MTYEETLLWLYNQLPIYQRQGQKAYKKDLKNILKLDAYLENPSKKFKSIHIGGTNGKGSVSHMLASILQEAGYTTGLYTSPHLLDFRERIRINGKMIRKNCVINFIKKHRHFFTDHNLSFFEMTVGMAFHQFAKKHVDIAIIEVGLGGRLDSTNIIHPELSIITNIGFDHMSILGNTLPEIAREKSGIIKPYTPVIIGKKQIETTAVFTQVAQQNNAQLIYSDTFKFAPFQTDLKGWYQQENLQTLLTAIHQLKKMGWQITDKNIQEGLQNVRKNTGLRGRWEILNLKPMIIADTAHNVDGLKIVMKQIQQTPHKQLHLVLSFVNDKNLEDILPLFPKQAKYYFGKAQIPRALNENILAQKANSFGLTGKTYKTLSKALQEAKKCAKEQDLIFIGGSTFTVAELLPT